MALGIATYFDLGHLSRSARGGDGVVRADFAHDRLLQMWIVDVDFFPN